MKKQFISILIFTLLPFLSLAQSPSVKVIEQVLSVEINSSINPATYSFLKFAYKKLQKNHQDMLLIKMSTPGGLITTTKKILTLMNQQNIPTVIWITPAGSSATSAGALIASGSHFIFMSKGTNIGAATPVSLGKSLNDKDDLRSKAINDLVALVESLSSLRKRDAKGYALMVQEAKSFSATNALKQGLITGIADSKPELFQKLEGQETVINGETIQLSIKNPHIQELQMDLGQKVLNIFSDPSSAYVLFLIGAALIYFELQAPGGFIAGSLGAISLILSGIGFQVLPVNFGAFGLLLLAFILFILEIFVTSYGILSIAGLTSLITGSLFLFRTDDAYLHFSHELIFSASGAVFLFLLFLGFVIFRDQKNVGKEKFNQTKGKQAKIIKLLSENHQQKEYIYQIKISGEIWKATSQNKYHPDDIVTVLSQRDNLLLEI